MTYQRTGRTKPFLNITLYELENGFWADEHDTIFALPDPKLALDDTNQAGFGWFVLPKEHFLSLAAPMHDYMFTSPIYQAFHTLHEANAHYLRNAALLGEQQAHSKFWLHLARLALAAVSDGLWDNPNTRFVSKVNG